MRGINCFFFLMIRRPPRSTHCISSAASDVYKRQYQRRVHGPLEVSTIDVCGTRHMVLAVNEVSLLRNSAQSAHVRVAIDGSVRLDKLVADGVLLSTPAGSTAYNYAAGGMIVPLETRVLLITPISPFRPRRWRGAVVPDSSVVQFVNLMTDKRPINVAADSVEMRDAVSATAVMRHDIEIRLLFDKENCIQERVMKEQSAEQGVMQPQFVLIKCIARISI
eukprot:TRINITY_DN30392_c0_g1_i1.p2 TRINITY_DN30392_c0_g1~~TRINITY_DN30392_c0_g1_i1.p2  ORF type:complete len:221 (-),score=13.22 TRINITY_DN30392_c0_g1_i1:143-805(-)